MRKKQSVQAIRRGVRIVQEYIIYFIWQVVYEIACYDYTEFGIRIVVSVKSFAPYKLKRRLFAALTVAVSWKCL